jgi:hypothetical protein
MGAMDAMVAWNSDNPQPGPDHKFNWFGLGLTQADAEKYFEPKHGITGNDVAVYEKYFDEAFTAIAHAIQDAIRSGNTELSTDEISGGSISLTSFGTVKVSGITSAGRKTRCDLSSGSAFGQQRRSS